MPSFQLRLEDSYWSKGFFNVGVDNQKWVTMTDGPIDLYLGNETVPITGRVSRSANQNATPRIHGNKPLADFFQVHYKRGDSVKIEILSPTSMRVGGSASHG
jgi:hypothetical protein